MCHHICPIGNATGQERNTARARAMAISLVNRGALALDEIIDNIYECATCGGCSGVCVTGWDPVMFTKEVRKQAALEGKLPVYIMKMVENCLDTGNAYGEKKPSSKLSPVFKRHAAGTGTLLYLGADTRYRVPGPGVKAAELLERAGIEFTLLKDEPQSGSQLDFLTGETDETKKQMEKAAKVFDGFSEVIIYDPDDARTVKRRFGELGVRTSAGTVTYTSKLADLLKAKALVPKTTAVAAAYQDPFQLSRELEETEPARKILKAAVRPVEMLMHGKETIWAGGCLMAEYMPDVMLKVAARRIASARAVGAEAIVTACPGEYAVLSKAADGFRVLSLEDLY